MAQYITFPTSAPNDLSQARLHSSETLSGLTNGTSYIAHRLSEASEPFTPEAAAGAITADAIVSNRGFWMQGTRAFGATAIQRRGRFVTAQGDVTNLRTVDAGWLVAGGDVVNPLPNSVTFGRYIEYPAGTRHPVTFGGASTATLVNGEVLVSDVVLDVATGLPLVIPAGAAYWEINTNPTGATQTYPGWLVENSTAYQMLVDGTHSLDAYSTALATHGTSTNAATIFSSIFVMGDILAANAKSAMLNGDSLMTGWVASGLFETGSARGEKGLARIPDALGWGYFNASSRGGTPAGLMTTLYAKISAVMTASGAKPSHSVLETGVNDITDKTPAALLADRASVRAGIDTLIPGIGFIDTTLTTSVATGSDTSSEAGQTITGMPGRLANMTAFNDGIRALAAAGDTTLWDLADITMTSRNSGFWKPGFVDASKDGLHMIAGGYAACETTIYAAPGL